MKPNIFLVAQPSSSASPPKSQPLSSKHHFKPNTGTPTPTASGYRSPKRSIYAKSKPRPIMPPRHNFQSVPNMNIDSTLPPQPRPIRRRRSSLDIGISEVGVSDINMLGAVPSSFATQMAMATARGKRQSNEETERMMGRLMLARMKTLEEGFQDRKSVV